MDLYFDRSSHPIKSTSVFDLTKNSSGISEVFLIFTKFLYLILYTQLFPFGRIDKELRLEEKKKEKLGLDFSFFN